MTSVSEKFFRIVDNYVSSKKCTWNNPQKMTRYPQKKWISLFEKNACVFG